MLDLESPSEGLLFFGVLYRSDLFDSAQVLAPIEALYGKGFSWTPDFNPLANYYSKEMGESSCLKRIFFVTTQTFPREFLLTSKLQSLVWERVHAVESKRMINIDTGFISAENFILATTKNYSHRIYLGQNIFSDLTYHCADGSYQNLPWTYPDFRDEAKINFLNWCRSYLLVRSKTKTL